MGRRGCHPPSSWGLIVFAALAEEDAEMEQPMKGANFPNLPSQGAWTRPTRTRAKGLARMPPRRLCQCLSPGSSGCVAAAPRRPTPPKEPDLAPLLLETGRDQVVFPLATGPPRRPEYQGYTRVEVAVDSGAAASVLPERCLPEHPVKPSEGSRSGVHYLAANGGRIPQQGRWH